jgi:DNA-directed RNA polymerase beta' subunit
LFVLLLFFVDCDGDTIIIHVPQKATTRTEVREIMNVAHQTLTPQSNKPVMGLIQDTVWAWKQATLRDVLMLDEDFHRYASKTQVPNWQRHVGRPAVMVRKAAILNGREAQKANESDSESDSEDGTLQDEYVALRTGKQLFSTVLPLKFHLLSSDARFQFDTTRPASVPSVAPDNALAARISKAEVWLKDMDIAILDHELIRGSIDSSITGKSSGGIAHHMALENTPDEMQAFFSSAQKVACPWTADEGLSTGPSDLTLSAANRRKLDSKMRQMLYAVQTYQRLSAVTNRQIQGARKANNHAQLRTSEAQLEKLEQKLCIALNDITTHLGEDAMAMAGPTNRMVQMISLAKSKGDKFNFTQMVVALGQQIVFGERIAIDDRITSHHPNRAEHFLPATIPEGDEAAPDAQFEPEPEQQAQPMEIDEEEEVIIVARKGKASKGKKAKVPAKRSKADTVMVVAPPAAVAASKQNAVMVENGDIEFDEEAEVALEVDADYQADGLLENGFIPHSYCQGLPPYQFYSHSMGGREGLLQTSEKTKETGA